MTIFNIEELLHNTKWYNELRKECNQPYWIQLQEFLNSEYTNNHIIFPTSNNIFKVFQLVELKNVKVVILGQDPYHAPQQAHGLAFSVPKGTPLPPSLRNIFRELENNRYSKDFSNGNLIHWAYQGVFLLNTVLTVRKKEANSHSKKGWEKFTDQVIQILSDSDRKKIFLLWGKSSQKKSSLINTSRHIILTSSHPSPLSAHQGFLGCKHFRIVNKILLEQGQEPISW